MASTSTSSFWLCPTCNKHVPARNTSCRCGFDRAETKAVVPVTIPSRPTFTIPDEIEYERPSAAGRVVKVAAWLLLFTGAAYMARRADDPPDPAHKRLAAGILASTTPAQPQIYYVPVPVRLPTDSVVQAKIGHSLSRVQTRDEPHSLVHN